MSESKQALIFTNGYDGRPKRDKELVLGDDLGPLLEVKIDRLRDVGVSDIFVVFNGFSKRLQREVESRGAEPVNLGCSIDDFLSTLSCMRKHIDRDFIITKARKIYPPEVLRLLSSFRLDKEFLLAANTPVGENFEKGRGIVFAEDVVTPCVKDIGDELYPCDAVDLELYLSSPEALSKAATLNAEGYSDVIKLVKELDSRVLPLSGVTCFEGANTT